LDINHIIGADFALTSSTAGTADVDTAIDPVEGQERVLRRLLTNPGDYVWQPAYGAGLAAYIGKPIVSGQINGVIRKQMRLEQVVVQSPPPTVSVNSDKAGTTLASIQYIDAASQLTSVLSIPITQIIAGDQ
jgi:hypothetical protein